MTWTDRECCTTLVPRRFTCRAVTFCKTRYKTRINQLFLACVSILLIGFAATSTIADSTSYRVPGLYKNGVKVADVEEVASSAQDTPAGRLAPAGGKGREFRRQVLGQDSEPSSVEHRRYVYHVIRCRDLVRQVSIDQESQSSMPSEVEQLLGLEDSLLVADQDLLAFFESITVSLRDNAYPAKKQQRHAKMVEQHQVAADRLVELLAGLNVAYLDDDRFGVDSRLRDLQQYFIDNIFQLEPRPISAQPLPVQKHVQAAPVRELSAQPAPVNYPVTMRAGPDPADLNATIDVQFSDEIIALAAQLNHSPMEIYSYVRENFEFEAYLGSRKGSQETLDHMRGNDYDQASLLIALLRVSGIPARYATGLVRMPTDRAKNWLGIEHAGNAGSILTTAGMEGVIILMGPDTVAIECKRVWVEAWLPYTNYRGAINDSTGFMWVPLDPTFKQYDYQLGINLPAEIGFDGETFVRDYYMTGLQAEPPVEVFKQMMLDSLAVYYPGATYDDLITTRSVIKETDGILPGTLPYELLSLDATYSEIPSNKRYQIQFHVYGGGTDMSYSTTLPEIVGKQVTISYVGATAADENTIDTAGGIFEIDLPYLVDLKPVLKIDGCEVARGTGAVMMGESHTSDMHFTAPVGASNQMPTVSNTITAGNYQGIGINTEDVMPAMFGEVPTACDENMLGQEQHQLALTYLNACNMSDDDLAGMLHLVVMNDVSEAIVENSVSVTYSGGFPQTMDWTGMIVDADRKIVGPFSVGGEDTDCDFMRVGGADGSIQENRLFENRFEEEAISAVKILEIAVDSGIAVCEITYNIDVECPGFNHDSSVRSAVQSAINAGHHVIIPQRSFTYYEWTGTGYIDIDPVTCAAGYIISGGQNGGATVAVWSEPWFNWLLGIVCMKYNEPIDVIPSGPNDMYCADSWAFWTFVVWNLDFYGKDDDGNCHKKFTLPRFFVVTKTIRAIAARWGPGDYVFKAEGATDICSECTGAEKKVTIVKVDIEQDKETKCHDETSASLKVKDSYSPGGYTWSSTPSGISGTGPSINYNPSGLTPAKYTVKAESNDLLGCKDECTVTIFKVDKLQYEQPSGTWNDVSGTIYVLKGSSVTFKAVPDPVEPWPSGKPVWGGTSGASGSGETKTVTFNALSTTLTDFKTVTATCGNVSSAITANLVVYDLTGTLTPVDPFTGRSQTKYGLEEIVNLAFTTDPAGLTAAQAGGLEWTKHSGVGAVSSAGNDGTADYDAEETAGAVTFRLTIKSGPSKDQFKSNDRTVIAPTGTRMTRTTGNVWHTINTASAGIQLHYWLNPTTVSFNNLEFGEGSAPTTGAAGILVGHAAHAQNFFGAINGGNATTGCRVNSPDHASIQVTPWNAGNGEMTWNIPTEYIDDTGNRHSFGTNQNHHSQVWVNGNATQTKSGHSGSAAATDPTSGW